MGTISQQRSIGLLSFFKLSFIHRVFDLYNFPARTDYFKGDLKAFEGIFILEFLFYIGEKTYKGRRGPIQITQFSPFANIWLYFA